MPFLPSFIEDDEEEDDDDIEKISDEAESEKRVAESASYPTRSMTSSDGLKLAKDDVCAG
jgi:hypothetical protein